MSLNRQGLLLIAALFHIPQMLPAQVPQLINYQGRVSVGGTNFDGIGQIKFALVNSNASLSFWSNDGTSSNGSAPVMPVAAHVANGLYSVLLGDSALANMTPIPPTVFTNGDVRLRVWFNDGPDGFQLLAPDSRIAAVGYAMAAGSASTVPAGSIGALQLATGAAAANLQAGGQSGVASGGIILATNPASANLLGAGYVKIGKAEIISENWEARGGGLPPAVRQNHTAVWTGSEMIVWGGINANYLNDGGRYNPVANTWTATPASGAPPRQYDTAIWTGSEMIVWGGYNNGVYLNDGARYNPAANTWTATAMNGAPSARDCQTAVWTGSEMIIWGGFNISYFNDGGRYNPVANTWAVTPTNGAPPPREFHTAIWTGTEMIVWAGRGTAATSTMARVTTPLPAAGPPWP